MDLAGFQLRLSEQYARLRDLRATENYPVYAIEHGLTAEECATAQALLNASLTANMRADRAHFLVWIAAAAEVGYRYDGTEYWDSFGAAFPDWRSFGDRNQIRSWYKKFAAEYRGLTPSGPWAGQFPIIAWPITQAILPKYLQRHFAGHLFDLRHVLVRSGEVTLDEIGDLLCERYYGGSSRFEGFLQQKALTARIVFALGTEGIEDTVPPIEKVTLDRIANDIDMLGSFGARLREARRVLRDARFVNSAKPGFAPKPKSATVADADSNERIERPRLVARPVSEDAWALSLAIPDLAAPLRQAGFAPRDMDRSPMRFRSYAEGSSPAPARGLFFYNGEHEEPVSAYPAGDVAVFSLERPIAVAEAVLAERLAFPAQPLRVLKMRADGAAFELAGRHVRANQSYILVSSSPLSSEATDALGLLPQQATATGAHLWRFDVPRTLDTTKVAALRKLGLGYQLAVRVEPFGLSPRWAAADGALVFLDTESAMFCVSADMAVREYLVSVDGLAPVRVTPSSGRQTFVALGPFTAGRHRVTFAAHGTATGGNIVAESFAIEVRLAAPWKQAIEGKSGVGLRLDPREAPLDQILDRRARIRAVAPPRRTVALKARFYGADGMLFHEEAVGRYNTPLSDDKLSEAVVQRLASDAQLDYLERAARIEVLITLDECGSGHVVFEKDAEPLRWLRIDDRHVRLSDDSADGAPPSIARYDLDAVDVAAAVDYTQAVAGIELRGKGGLFVATVNGRHYEAIATSIRRQMTDLKDLGVPASLSPASHRPEALLNALKRWHGVRRTIGPMAFAARSNAIGALERALTTCLCGADWLAAADKVRDGQRKIGDLYGMVYYSRGFASGIANFQWRYDADEAAANTELARLLGVYKIDADQALAPAALKLAFQPNTLSAAECQSAELFEALRTAPALVRGAFFARFASDLAARNVPPEAA